MDESTISGFYVLRFIQVLIFANCFDAFNIFIRRWSHLQLWNRSNMLLIIAEFSDPWLCDDHQRDSSITRPKVGNVEMQIDASVCYSSMQNLEILQRQLAYAYVDGTPFHYLIRIIIVVLSVATSVVHCLSFESVHSVSSFFLLFVRYYFKMNLSAVFVIIGKHHCAL